MRAHGHGTTGCGARSKRLLSDVWCCGQGAVVQRTGRRVECKHGPYALGKLLRAPRVAPFLPEALGMQALWDAL